MRRQWRTWGRMALVVGITATCGNDITAPPQDALAVLFIGNSLTYFNEMPRMVAALLEDGGHGPVDVRSSSYPDYGLQDHWVDSRSRDAISAGGWDYVVLQQGPSATEGRPSLLQYAEMFAGEIDAIGAQTALYMVWPSQSRFFDFDGVSDSYATAAANVGGVLFPAGEAWRAAWSVDADLPLYGPDGFHPSVLGSYLAALTIYQRITGAETRDVPPAIRWGTDSVPLDPEMADLLYDAARAANEMFDLAPTG